MFLKLFRRLLVSSLTVAGILLCSQSALANHVAYEVADVISSTYENTAVQVLPGDSPDTIILRGGPVSNDMANQISLAAAKVTGVATLINEIEIQ